MSKMRRKPLPYAAIGLLQQAENQCELASKSLITVLDNPSTPEEKYRLIGRALHCVDQIQKILREVPVICGDKQS